MTIEIKDGDLVLVAIGYLGNYQLAKISGKVTDKTAMVVEWWRDKWEFLPSRKDRGAIKGVLPADTDPCVAYASLRALDDRRAAAIKQVNAQHEARIEKLISGLADGGEE